MRIEEKLGETMKRATADEPLPRDVWNAFERRARRSQRVRYVSAGVALAVIVALAALAIPRLSGDRDQGFAGDNGSFLRFRQPTHHYEIRYPDDWIAVPQADTVVLHPMVASDAPLASGFFRLEISWTPDYALDRLYTRPEVSGVLRRGSIGGHRFVFVGGETPTNDSVGGYMIEWDDGAILSARIQGDQRNLRTLLARAEIAKSIVHSLREWRGNDPTAGWQTLVDEKSGLQLRYPLAWSAKSGSGDLGAYDLGPLSSSSPGDGLPFSIQIKRLRQDFDNTSCSALRHVGCDGINMADSMFEGRRFVRRDERRAGSGTVVYRVEWGTHMTLEIDVVAATPSLWGEFGATAERIIGSIRHL